MRVDAECSCGAKVSVGFEASRPYHQSHEHAEAQRILDQFRKDHRACRISAAASQAVKEQVAA